jgi:Fur family ferric uptake transcriptional regulator
MNIKKFKKFLKNKGLKLTKERTAVLNQILSFHGHFEPEAIYLGLKESGSKASRASVYRTLNLLVESSLVEKVTTTEKGTLYELSAGHNHHDHLICDSCGEMIEFFSEKIESLQEEICRQNRFTGDTHSLVIRGACEQCRNRLQ